MDLDVSVTINELIRALSLAIDTEEETKHYHGWRVALLYALLAQQCDHHDSREMFYGAMLHDIGAAGLPKHILHYADRPTTPREPILTAHPLVSAEIIVNIPGLEDTAAAIVQHHENWGGGGYPQGLRGGEISLDAQLLHLADFIDVKLRDPVIHTNEQLIGCVTDLQDQAFSADMVDLAGEVIRKDFFEELYDLRRLPDIFFTTKDYMGPLCLQSGIDAIAATLRVFARVIDAKHSYTIGHSRRVTRYSVLIGLALGLERQEITQLEWAGLLHDVGKLSIPRAILDKPSELSTREYSKVKNHARLSHEIISMISDLHHIAPIAAGHHERMDGKGYPQGLMGEEIPFGARILCVSDAFDAMTSNRPYKPDVSIARACEVLEHNAGSQFDEEIVKVAVPILSNLGQLDMEVSDGSPIPQQELTAFTWS
jgi:HD-GYP domain-containing protein (c-di-GMP phosphodiesterase class II)